MTGADELDAWSPRDLGATGIKVPGITIGTARWREGHQRCASRADSREVMEALSGSGRLVALDTANSYGESESRIGEFFKDGYPADVLVQTKADRNFADGDFSGDQMMRSLRESCERLGLESLPIVYLHDPENTDWDSAMAPNGPVAALARAKEEGLIGHLGLSGGPVELLLRYLDTGYFEALITHMRWTLVDRSAGRLLDVSRDRGIGVMNAAPYGGGILANPGVISRYAYGEAKSETLVAVDRIAKACARAEVPVAALALQFSLRDPRVDSTIVGVLNRSELEATQRLCQVAVPGEVWAVVEEVLPDEAAWEW